jgi:hypothetical protein
MVMIYLCALATVGIVLAMRPRGVSPAHVCRIARGTARDPTRSGDPWRTRPSRRATALPSMSWRRRSRVVVLPTPLLLDLAAEIVASGVPPARALAAVARCLEAVPGTGAIGGSFTGRDAGSRRAHPPAEGPGGRGRDGDGFTTDDEDGLGPLASAIDLAVATGAGPVELIRAAAEEERHRRQARGLLAARQLGVSVLLPTGLCLLPAFLLLTVVPLALDLLLG